MNAPVVVVGSGLAGLSAAWAISPADVVLVTANALGEGTASAWAQGGIAAALGADDHPGLHARDTFTAGAGAGDLDTISRITNLAPGVVRELVSIGVDFDRRVDGSFDLALEGGHGRNRIAHVGDRSGAAITAALAAHVRTLPGVHVREHTELLRLLVDDLGAVSGVEVSSARGAEVIEARRVILATGGLGALFAHTTNPLSATGRGIAIAGRVGARLDDLHLVQFHPTALDVGLDPMPLLTEALRGAGATLLADGRRFVDELRPRDVVSAAVWDQLQEGRKVSLDARGLPEVTSRFPRVAALVAQAGPSLSEDLLPVRPAVHYSMGGVTVDECSRTSVPGLWAVGEVARTGLHGANRLASNSLLEAVVTGRAAGLDATDQEQRASQLWPAVVAPADPLIIKHLDGPAGHDDQVLATVRALLTKSCGVLREGEELFAAVEQLADLTDDNAGYVGWLIARSAFLHGASIGAHRRIDDRTLAGAA
ncbi:MAG: FAD-binding protein [Nocardioidaceae bacterium]